MRPPAVDPTALPRAGALTDALLAPADMPATADGAAVRSQCLAIFDQLAEGCPPGERLRVDGYLLRTVALEPGRLETVDGFRWSPRTARRLVGLKGVRHCIRGACRTPTDGVAKALAEAFDDVAEGRQRPGSLGHWLTTLQPGGLAVVRAEAVTWATGFLGALQWVRLGRPSLVAGPDQWWSLPKDPAVSIRGRAEVRAALPEAAGESVHHRARRPSALFVVMNGRPWPGARHELSLPALVSVLAHPSERVPERVVGWWPQCGRSQILPVDGPLLESTAQAVVGAIRAVAMARGWPRLAGDVTAVRNAGTRTTI